MAARKSAAKTPQTLFIAGSAYTCSGKALDPNYNGTYFTLNDLKNIVQDFYRVKRRYTTKSAASDAPLTPPPVLDLCWAHPNLESASGRIGEIRDMFVDDRNRLVVISRINTMTKKGREIADRLLAKGKPYGISLDHMVHVKGTTSDPSTTTTEKRLKGASLVDKPAARNAYVEMFAETERELLEKLFSSSSMVKKADDDDESPSSLSSTDPNIGRPIFINRSLRRLVKKHTKLTLTPNMLSQGLQPDSDKEDDSGEQKEEVEEDGKAEVEKDKSESDEEGENEEASHSSEDEMLTQDKEKQIRSEKGPTKKATSRPPPSHPTKKRNTRAATESSTASKIRASKDKKRGSAKKKVETEAKTTPDPDAMDLVEEGKEEAEGGDEENTSKGTPASDESDDEIFDPPTDSVPSSKRKTDIPSPQSTLPPKSSKRTPMSGASKQKQQQPKESRSLRHDTRKTVRENPAAPKRRLKEPVEDLHSQEESDAMDQEDIPPTPPPSAPTPRSSTKKAPPAQRREDANEAPYDYSMDDLTQQLSQAMEKAGNFKSLLHAKTPEARSQLVDNLLKQMALDLTAEMETATKGVSHFLEATDAPQEVRENVSSITERILKGERPSDSDLQQYAYAIAASASRLGSGAGINPALIEDEVARKRRRVDDEPRDDEYDDEYDASSGVTFDIGGQRSTSTVDFDPKNVSKSEWGSSFLRSAFHSSNFSSSYQQPRYGYQDPMDVVPPPPARRPQRDGPSSQSRPGAQHPQDRNLSGGRGGQRPRQDRPKDDREAAIELLKRQRAFNIVAETDGKAVLDSTDLFGARGMGGLDFGFEEMAKAVKPNGFVHEVITRTLFPTERIGRNAAHLEELSSETRAYYDDPSRYDGFVPRVIHTGIPLVMAEIERESHHTK